MGARFDSTGILIRKGGRTILNSRDKFLHGNTWGFPIQGSQSIANLTGGNGTRIDSTTTYNLASAPSGHVTVYGAVKFDLNNDDVGIAFNRWHTVMNGSILWVMDGSPADGIGPGDNLSVRQYVDYHFRIASGQVQLVRRAFISNSPGTVTILAHNITYKLRTGLWT